MAFHYSRPFESLITNRRDETHLTTARVVIVGSGYGGSVAAFRLADPDFSKSEEYQHDVLVLERGKEYTLGEFPNDLADLPAHLRIRQADRLDSDGTEDALFDIRLGDGVDALVGSGLGGTSLINANVAIRPASQRFSGGPWPLAFQDKQTITELDDAFDAVSAWLDVASPNCRAALKPLVKYRALSRYADALELDIEPAPITVMLQKKQNAAGITQEACTHCGNCVTGCNIGAKNTLAMNLIPAAHACGAEFYTGSIVYSVEPVAASDSTHRHWRVYVKPVSQTARARFDKRCYIQADTVILCAGTFGSTEILKRSVELGYIRCSDRLGAGFSTNGDGISMSFAENEPVDALGSRDYVTPVKPSGPTITSCARPRTGAASKGVDFLLEDGAIPSPLVEIIGEVLTTAAQFGRIGYNRLPGWFKGKSLDPLAVHRGALEHSQVFLIMSDDGAKGQLSFRGKVSADAPEGGGVVPVWSVDDPAGPNPTLAAIDARLAQHDRRDGLSHGQYVHNPLWKLLPEAATEKMSGRFPGGRLLTVHPLGGCAMGDSIKEGVVNHNGQVYDARDGKPLQGLYVMDGSILPGALGENPFLTIAALAWRACNHLAVARKQFTALEPLPRTLQPPAPREADDAEIIIREQMVGALEVGSEEDKEQLRRAFPTSPRWFEHDRLVLRIETKPSSTQAALAGTGKVAVIARLYESPVSGDQALRWHTYGVASKSLKPEHLIASGEGTMTIMEAAAPASDKELLARRRSALRAFRSRRDLSFLQKLGLPFAPLLSGPVTNKDPGKRWPPKPAQVMLSIAEMHSTYRRFVYDLRLHTSIASGARPVNVAGQKQIAWTPNNPRFWQAFSRLDAAISFGFPAVEAKSKLYVDMDYVMGDGLLSVASDKNTPHAIFNCLAYVMRLARCAVQAGFWEFGAPNYPDTPVQRASDVPAKIGGVRRKTHSLVVDERLQGDGKQITLKLHQYGSGGKSGPALLLHGLAQGSLIFAHDKLDVGMAHYFLGQGYDVWMLDYRLSNQFDADTIKYDKWAIDEIGRLDIPAAIDHVFAISKKKIHVFAHCVGAVGISMAILRGEVSADQLASVALNAIHPWVMPSPYNKVRAKVGVVFRDLIGNDYLDPILQTKYSVSAAQSIIDRLAFSLARLDEEDADRHALDDKDLANAICDRMTFLYGRMWRHANVKSIHRYWKDLVGRAPGAVYRHLHYLLTWERIVDREGNNEYLTPDRLRNWQGIRTLFMHGEDSMVFNPQSATRSAIRLRQAIDELRKLDRAHNQSVPETPVRLRRVPGYGHMDVILANDAHERSFQYLHYFFAGKFDSSNSYCRPDGQPLTMDIVDQSDDPDADLALEAVCGPVLRAARMDNGKLIARFWLETPVSDITPLRGIDLLEPKPLRHSDVSPAGVDPCYCWIDAEYDSTSFSHFGLPWRARLEQLSQRQLTDCHFIVASCCYPGTPFDRELTDQAFAGINTLLNRGEVCDLVFLIGDQIYADASAGLFDPLSWRDRYIDRYWNAFRSRHARQLWGKIPTHFAIDDHEIANDFAGVPPAPTGQLTGLKPGKERILDIRTAGIDQTQLDFAKRAARSYVGAARDKRPFGVSHARAGALWYALDDQAEISCPAFVMDARSDRQRASATGADATMMKAPQLSDLILWLDRIKQDDRPKFIFSGSVVAPLELDSATQGMWMREGGFAGYPTELEHIVAYIVEHDIRRVVFVGGDLHLSCTAELMLSNDRSGKDRKEVRAFQIVSSGLYAPFAFANTLQHDIRWGSTGEIRLRNHSIAYRPELLAGAVSSFVKVSATPLAGGQWSLSVSAYDREANLINPGPSLQF